MLDPKKLEEIAKQIIALPFYPELENLKIEKVIGLINKYFEK